MVVWDHHNKSTHLHQEILAKTFYCKDHKGILEASLYITHYTFQSHPMFLQELDGDSLLLDNIDNKSVTIHNLFRRVVLWDWPFMRNSDYWFPIEIWVDSDISIDPIYPKFHFFQNSKATSQSFINISWSFFLIYPIIGISYMRRSSWKMTRI